MSASTQFLHETFLICYCFIMCLILPNLFEIDELFISEIW